MAEMLLRVFANNITRSQVPMQSCLQANRTPSTPTHAYIGSFDFFTHAHRHLYIRGKKLKTLPCLHVLHCILIRQRKEVVMNCEHAVSFHLWTPHRLAPFAPPLLHRQPALFCPYMLLPINSYPFYCDIQC